MKKLYKGLGWAAGFLNVLDAIFTLYAVNMGLAQEVNPAMAYLLNYPVLFVLVKLLAFSLFVWLGKMTKISICIVFLLYYGIVCIQLGYLLPYWISNL